MLSHSLLSPKHVFFQNSHHHTANTQQLTYHKLETGLKRNCSQITKGKNLILQQSVICFIFDKGCWETKSLALPHLILATLEIMPVREQVSQMQYQSLDLLHKHIDRVKGLLANSKVKVEMIITSRSLWECCGWTQQILLENLSE